MLWNKVSEGAKQCCSALWAAGFEAYPVGGCVRDLLLGRAPGDWDVTTNALPEQVQSLFDHVIATGVKHGTVTVILGEEHLEVTTFRGESGYSDGRHPDMVRFDATLEQDLARRDFTINAMALGRDGMILDLFGGRDALAGKIIRCVGDPARRFEEDGLRMFRAVRFAAQLGFALSEETERAVRTCAGGAERIASERIRVEVEKTLCSDRPEKVADFFALGLMRDRGELSGTALALREVPPRTLLRWAGLCGLLLRDGEQTCQAFLNGFRLERRRLLACTAGERLFRAGLPAEEADWRRALVEYGADGCRAAAAMGIVCGCKEALEQLEQVFAQNPCVRVENLALSGGDLARLGLQGAEIGAAQRFLLEYVVDRPEDNRAEVLARKAEEFLSRL